MKTATIALLLICTAAFAQQKGTFKDTRDGKTYKTVKIGTQTWMAENLNYNAKSSKCGNGGNLSDNNTASCDKYGRLYKWATAMNIDAKFNDDHEEWYGSDVKHQGICPSGWHLPSENDWQTLVNFVSKNGSVSAGKVLKAKSGWMDYDKEANGTEVLPSYIQI